jgi:predicted transcriptional regulator
MAVSCMGVPENINWLKESKIRWKIFAIIATGRASKIRDLRVRLDMIDWWQMKQYVKDLVDRGLITEVDGNCRLTEDGQKVFESLQVVGDIEKLG